MAKYFVEETGRGTDGHRLSEYSQDHKPILQQDEIVGHAVRAGYLYSGVADVASLTQDTAYFNALSRIWENMASKSSLSPVVSVHVRKVKDLALIMN